MRGCARRADSARVMAARFMAFSLALAFARVEGRLKKREVAPRRVGVGSGVGVLGIVVTASSCGWAALQTGSTER